MAGGALVLGIPVYLLPSASTMTEPGRRARPYTVTSETDMTSTSTPRSASSSRSIVHRPGLELARLTPANVDELLFDDVMWAERAREEHDAFVEQLGDQRRASSTTSPSCWPRPSTSRAPGSSSRTG